MTLDSLQLEPAARDLLALVPDLEMPLVCKAPVADAGALLRGAKASELFPRAYSPDAAMAGLWLYFSYFSEAHSIAQDLETPEGSYWHAIIHRQEPDAWNSGYWFRRVGEHPIFPALLAEAKTLGYPGGNHWSPAAFIDYCSTGDAAIARAAQMAEWRLLFAYCARRAK